MNKNYIIWSIAERSFRLLSGFLLYAILAKYIGVKDFGILNLATGVVAILSTLIYMGADNYNLYRLKDNENIEVFIGSILVIRSVVFFVLFIFLLFCLNNFPEIRIYILILSMTMFFAIFSVFVQYIQSQGYFVLFSKLSCISLLLGGVIKIFGIYTNKSLLFFIYAIVLENLILTFLVLKYSKGFYYVVDCVKKTTYDYCLRYLKLCFPLAISSFLVAIYFKSEVILISKYLGVINTGYWGVLMISLVPWSMLTSALAPIINYTLSKQEVFSNNYYVSLIRILRMSLCIAVFGCFFNIIFSQLFLTSLFGDTYENSKKITIIAALAIIPIFLGSIQDISIAHRQKTGIVLKKVLLGLPLSILLFFSFSYIYGLNGAAISLVLSYFVTSVFLNIFFDRYFFDATLKAVCFWRR